QVQMFGASPALQRGASPSSFDEDAPHCFGRRGEKMSPVLPANLLAAEPQPGFVNEGCWLERLPTLLANHLAGGEAAQLVIDQRTQLVGGLRVTQFNGLKHAGQRGHAQSVSEMRRRRTRKRKVLNSGHIANAISMPAKMLSRFAVA